MRRACAATDFTASPTSTSPGGSPRSRPKLPRAGSSSRISAAAPPCARIVGGKSVESTMGFTALDGLPMGTRPGQLDAGVVLYLMSEKGMSAKAIERLLYNDCGLKGLSGISNDVSELLASSDPRAKLALDYFVYRIALFTGMLAAAMGGIDGFVFTAGIGENAPAIREAVVRRLSWLGLELDAAANAKGGPLISRKRSRVACYVIPTDEELMIARHTLRVLREHASPRARGETSMIDLSSLALLKGKKALVTGIANDQSIAWGCAKAFHALRCRRRRHLSQRQVETLRRTAGQGDRGADLHAAGSAARGPAGGRLRDNREEVGQARSVPAFDRLCAEGGSAGPRRRLLERRASCWPWRSRAGRSSAWRSWPSP